MYFPESVIIASENTHLIAIIEQVDHFLAERNGRPFYAGDAADALRLTLPTMQGILNLYKGKKVLSERKVWICVNDGQEINFVTDELLHCDVCGTDYTETQCKVRMLYQPRPASNLSFLEVPEVNSPSLTVPEVSHEDQKQRELPEARRAIGDSQEQIRTHPPDKEIPFWKDARFLLGLVVVPLIIGVCASLSNLLGGDTINVYYPSPPPFVTGVFTNEARGAMHQQTAEVTQTVDALGSIGIEATLETTSEPSPDPTEDTQN